MAKYGINDLPYGWISANNWNKKAYHLWHRMLKRCYSEKWHEKNPTYKDCTVCNRWLVLSNFVEDIVKIDGYQLWLSGLSEKRNPYQLDKDIKSGGTNKCYCLEECIFVSCSENSRQAMSTRDYDNIKGRKPSEETRQKMSKAHIGSLIDRYTINKIYIDTKYQFQYVQLGFNQSAISKCCKGKLKSHKGFIFHYHEE